MRSFMTRAMTALVPAVAAAALIAPPALGFAPAAAGSVAAPRDHAEMRLRHRDADAAVLYDSLVVTLGPDNRISKRRHRAVMLFSDNAINRYGDPRLLYNAATQDLEILAARVRMRDGKLVDARQNAINRTTPFALDLTPDYADWQETVVTLMGIEKGCVAELHYVIVDKNPSPWLSGVEVFSAEDPTEERVLAVTLPARMRLKHAELSGGAGAPDTSAAGSWIWTVRDIPGRTPVDGGMWEGDYFPAVCYSTAAGSDEVFTALRGQIAGKSPALPASLSEMMRERIKDCATFDDRAIAIQRLAMEVVRSVSVPYPLFAAPARDAARIYDTGYASPLDRAVLLMAMLEDAELDPKPVLVSAGRAVIGDVPAPELYTKILVAVGDVTGPVEGHGLYLDPLTRFERLPVFSLPERTFVFLGAEPSKPFVNKNANRSSRSELTLALTPGQDGGFEGKGSALLAGVFSPYYLVREGENGLRDFLKKRVSGLFGGAELVSWNPRLFERTRVEIDFTFAVPLRDAKKGERAYFSMPKPFDAQLSGLERVRPERSYCGDAIAIEPSALVTTCTMEIPPGWRMVTGTYEAHADPDNAFGIAWTSFKPESENVYRFEKRLVPNAGVVLPASFGEFRSFMRAVGEDRIVLEKE